MANADGSVIIKARVDVSQADKDLAKMKDKIGKTEEDIEDLSQKKAEAESQSVFSAAELDAEKAKLAEMKRDLQEMRDIAKDATLSPSMRNEAKAQIPKQQQDITDQQARVRMLQSEYDKIYNSVARYDQRLTTAKATLDKQVAEAGELAQKINSVSKASVKMAEAQKEAEKNAQRFAMRLKSVVRSALVFTVITKALSSLRDWAAGVITSNDEARESIARLKGALLTLAQPLVNVVIPAFTKIVDLLTVASVAIGRVFSSLAGESYEDTQKAAEALNKEKEALNGVGDAAKKAEGQLASFDEINTLGSADQSNSYIAPDFSGLATATLPDWLTSLTAKMSDIIFEWEDLTAQDVIEKVVASLITLAGTVIGFSVGGVGGAVIGMALGMTLGAWLSDLIFDNDKKLNTEELLSSLCTALTAVAGTLIGFSVGGVGGAAIGLTVGASAGVGISKLLFDDDGRMSREEVLKSFISAVGAVVGGVLGFKIGGPKGAAIGATLGAGAVAAIMSMTFDNDGRMSREEILKLLCNALFGVAGGVLGFFVGGPKGAAIGASATLGFSAWLNGIIFDNDGVVSTRELVKSLCVAAGALVGGIIGFIAGGPGGALIGLTVGAALTINLEDIFFKGFQDLKKYVPNFTGIGPDYSWLFKSSASVSSIPGLATGAVVPPNREFMAVLGDNKTETEIVSPLSTMKQAMLEAMRESGRGSGGQTTIVLDGDLAALARVLRPYIEDEGRRVGVTLVTR